MQPTRNQRLDSKPEPKPEPKHTPLHSLHLQHDAKITPFAGYAMPVSYPNGILTEHRHTRAKAGLFDVSHMGQISIPIGDDDTAALALESLLPSDLLGLPCGRQRYALLTNDAGGIIDDLMIQRLAAPERFVLVVNAACKAQDFAHLYQHLGDTVSAQLADDHELALLALQGPAAATALAATGFDPADMGFMEVREMTLAGVNCVVSRSGYTGEDGFEISVAAAHAEHLARALLAHPAVELAGLGARDSLRLEAGLCLYGQDIDTQTTPVEATLGWAISPARRRGGRAGESSRAGGFPGADVILAQLADGVENLPRRRVGLLPEGRAPVRRGAELLDNDSQVVGKVTSGGFAPSLQRPVSMGYVQPKHAAVGTQLQARVRGKLMPVTVAEMPFVPARYYRKI